MRYAGIIKCDTAAAPGFSVSFYTQGCPFHCPNCQNPQTWDYNGGKEFTPQVLEDIIQALHSNGVAKSLAILGGEPLCEQNTFLTLMVISEVKRRLPDTPVYLWTGYYYNQLLESHDPRVAQILELVDVLIDGPYIEALRDITLPMRGSSNQNIIELTKEK